MPRTGTTRTPAEQFAAELERSGAIVRWRDVREFEARRGQADALRAVEVMYHPVTGRFRGAVTEQGKTLLTKRGVRVHLGVYPYTRQRFDAAPIPPLGLTPK